MNANIISKVIFLIFFKLDTILVENVAYSMYTYHSATHDLTKQVICGPP
jgi:hypothetical protein